MGDEWELTLLKVHDSRFAAYCKSSVKPACSPSWKTKKDRTRGASLAFVITQSLRCEVLETKPANSPCLSSCPSSPWLPSSRRPSPFTSCDAAAGQSLGTSVMAASMPAVMNPVEMNIGSQGLTEMRAPPMGTNRTCERSLADLICEKADVLSQIDQLQTNSFTASHVLTYLCSSGHASATRACVMALNVAAPAPTDCHSPAIQTARTGNTLGKKSLKK